MNEADKVKYLKGRCDLIKGCIVTELEPCIEGDAVSLISIKLRHPDGNEFKINSLVDGTLHIVQTFWGS